MTSPDQQPQERRIAPYALIRDLSTTAISAEGLTDDEYTQRLLGAQKVLGSLLRVSGHVGFDVPAWPPEHVEPFTNREAAFYDSLTEVKERGQDG